MKKLLFFFFTFSLAFGLKAQTVVFQPSLTTNPTTGTDPWTSIKQASSPADTQVVANVQHGIEFIHNGHSLAALKTGLSTADGNCLLLKFDLTIDSSQNSNGKAFTIELGNNLTNAGSANISNDYSALYIATNDGADASSANLNNGATSEPSSAVATPVQIQWIVNRSGSVITYTGADGSSGNTIANDTWDAWMGNTKVFSGQAALNTLNAINSVRIQANASGVQTANFNNFEISTIPNNMALPIHFSSFTAQKSGNVVQLSWSTSAESNRANFQVMRSSDGENFLAIGNKIVAAGNAASTKNYTYTDVNPLSGNNFYQIIEEDKDGHISKSNIILLKAPSNTIKIYPNPTSNLLKISGAKGTVSIYDISGKLITTQSVENTECSIDVRNLAPGVYIIKSQNVSSEFIKK